MLDESKLIGWLCFIRLQVDSCDEDPGFVLPDEVVTKFVTLGWMTYAECDDPECDRSHSEITDMGNMVYDLNAPEWGIDPIYSENK